MGDQENKVVVLHGMWASPSVKRVELALKIKGIPFDFVEEDLRNKSPLLLQYNPVHKKVPILVHNGKPICESLIILEYIDEKWPNGPELLPKDPYERAKVRFWAAYIQKLYENMGKLFTVDKGAQEKGLEEVHEKLKIMENEIKEFLTNGSSFSVNAEKLGILDIMMVATLGPYKALEEVLEIKILDPQRNPLILSWVEALIMLPLVKEITPPHDKFIGLLQFLKENGVKSP